MLDRPEKPYGDKRRTRRAKMARTLRVRPSEPREYVAQVVRVEKLPNGKFGVAVDLLMTVNYSAGAPKGSLTRA